VDHGVSSVVHSATKVAHRLIRLIFHLFGTVRSTGCEVIHSFRGDGLFKKASFISQRFSNSSYKMGRHARETGAFFMATKVGKSDETLQRSARAGA
jgi:hypothetical protein